MQGLTYLKFFDLFNEENKHSAMTRFLDTIHHDKLIGRLESDLGIIDNALAWFKSYLSDRFQRVSVNGSLSDQFPLKQGVPQGSCLGPLLFTIYTRKLFQIVERHLPQVHCYADDTQLYVSFSPNRSADADFAIKSMTDCIIDIRSYDKTEFFALRRIPAQRPEPEEAP